MKNLMPKSVTGKHTKTAVVLLREYHHFHCLHTYFRSRLEGYGSVVLLVEIDSNLTINAEVYKFDKRYKILQFKSWVFYDLIFSRRSLVDFKKICELIVRDSLCIDFYSFYYLSDSALLAFAIFKSRFFYLFDEGGASIEVACQRGELRGYDIFRLTVKSLLLLKQIKTPSSVKFITRFQISINYNDQLILVVTKKNTIKNNVVGDLVWIIGTSAVALGIICKTFYFNLLKRLKEKHRNKVVVYISHRKESPLDLDLLRSNGILVESFSQPIEVAFENVCRQPSIIYSIATSCALFELWYKYVGLPRMFYVEVPRLCYLKNYIVYKNIVKAYSVNGQIPVINV
jgi:hypothetical protein